MFCQGRWNQTTTVTTVTSGCELNWPFSFPTCPCGVMLTIVMSEVFACSFAAVVFPGHCSPLSVHINLTVNPRSKPAKELQTAKTVIKGVIHYITLKTKTLGSGKEWKCNVPHVDINVHILKLFPCIKYRTTDCLLHLHIRSHLKMLCSRIKWWIKQNEMPVSKTACLWNPRNVFYKHFRYIFQAPSPGSIAE